MTNIKNNNTKCWRGYKSPETFNQLGEYKLVQARQKILGLCLLKQHILTLQSSNSTPRYTPMEY